MVKFFPNTARSAPVISYKAGTEPDTVIDPRLPAFVIELEPEAQLDVPVRLSYEYEVIY